MRRVALLTALLQGSAVDAYSPGATGLRSYAQGVNPPPHQRAKPEKMVWAYIGAVTQGEAEAIYNAAGAVTVEDVLNTAVNQLSFISNLNANTSTGWWRPGVNNTGGCGQDQTRELPFGYDGTNKSTEAASLPIFQKNVKKLHDAGITMTLTMGSWCTQLPVHEHERWNDNDFTQFVEYFKLVREKIFGGALDGIDFDWEGYCDAGCLKGTCICAWDDKICGTKTPDELAKGVFWSAPPVPGQKPMKHQCWIMPTTHTFQVMAGMTHAMKKAGFVVTLVPMSVALWTGEPDTSANQVMRNEYGKYRKQTSLGEEVDLLDLADGILLQWYSGFDAALCTNTPASSKACTCDNIPAADYPNVLDNKKNAGGLLSSAWQTYWNVSGNHFPKSYPVRCQACGDDVILPDGTRGKFPCADEEESWFVPSMNRSTEGANPAAVVSEHNAKLDAYVAKHNDIPQWWVKGKTVPSACPRAIDCPDWRYEGEPAYSRQVKLLKSISQIVDLAKVSIGFETLGIDVQVQMESWEDHALPWTTSPLKDHKPPTPYANYTYYKPCTQNMTVANYKDNKRCAQPLLSQQWGPKFDADEVVGLEAAVRAQTGKELGGVGFFTLDGFLSQKKGKARRYWHAEMQKLNTTYKLPCMGDCCGCAGDDPFKPTPAPDVPHGSYQVQAGDSCWSIANKLCDDGNSWKTEICDATSLCSNLWAGATIRYDCSGKGTYCGKPAEIVI